MKITRREQRIQAIEKLKSDLRKSRMKDRNKWLLAYGALLEKKFKQADAQERRQWIEMAKKRLKGWLQTRALAGFSDLAKRFPPALPGAAAEEGESVTPAEITMGGLEIRPAPGPGKFFIPLLLLAGTLLSAAILTKFFS